LSDTNPPSHCNSHCKTLQHTLPQTLHYNSRHSDTLQHTATHCNTLQHTATHYLLSSKNLLQIHKTHHDTEKNCNTLQHTLPHTHWITMQHTATHYLLSGKNFLQHTLQRRRQHCNALCRILQYAATHRKHYNTLSIEWHTHTATYCNTLQRTITLKRTATPCNILQKNWLYEPMNP